MRKTMSSVMSIISAICTVLLILLSGTTMAWSNGGYSDNSNAPKFGTHDWIATKALEFLPDNEKTYIVQNIALYKYGTELPDNSYIGDGIGDTGKHHVYFTKSGNVVDDSSARRASETFNSTVQALQNKDYAVAARMTGVMTHYICDVAVFGHVMGSETDWGEEKHHSDYESYVDNHLDDFNGCVPKSVEVAKNSAYNLTLELASKTTFGDGFMKNCTWMDSNYDWASQVFKDSAGMALGNAIKYVAAVIHILSIDSRYSQNNNGGNNWLLSSTNICGVTVPNIALLTIAVLALSGILIAIFWRR